MLMMASVPTELCYTEPYRYRLCDKDFCIPIDAACPCVPDVEFQCTLGSCIPIEFKCDGLQQCLYGEDEKLCERDLQKQEGTDVQTSAVTKNPTVTVETSKEMQLSIPIVVTIASVCVFVCILLIFLLCLFIARRQKNNTSRESQSVSEPLRKSYITSDIEAADAPGETGDHYETTISRKRDLPERMHYLPIETEGNTADYHRSNYQIEKRDDDPLEQCNDIEKVNNKGTENLAINPGVEIYNINHPDTSKVSGLGKYTFKPRLKYLTSKPYFEIEEKDREKLYVINSYKHCSGKSIIPSTLTFDKDPEKFSDRFATDLLCSSTPRPGAKHLDKKERSWDGITSHLDNDLDL